MINQAVPPGGDSGIALRRVEACDLPKRGRLGCAIFGRGGLRSRIPRIYNHKVRRDVHCVHMNILKYKVLIIREISR